MRRPYTVGLTGPTGAGKSTVAKEFTKAGIPVLDADRYARLVMEAGSPVLESLAESFGRDILYPDGTLNRKELAHRAFADEAATLQLNSLTHPAIWEAMLAEAERLGKQGHRCLVVDAPQLYESGGQQWCDTVISVIAPRSVRLQRILRRDGICESAAMERIKAQPSDDFYRQADVVLENNGTLLELVKKAQRLVSAVKERKA